MEIISPEERMSGYLFETMQKQREQEKEKASLLERLNLLEKRVAELEAAPTKRARRR